MKMTTVKTVLVTGSNRGIGLEFTRQYLADGWRVIAASRTANTPALLELQQRHGSLLRREALDVSDFAAIADLGQRLTGESIAVLINNAGVYGGEKQSLGNTDVVAWQQTLAVNTIAPLKLVESLLPLLSPAAVIANLTSLMGSVADNGSGAFYAYRSSKAALNAVSKSLAIDLAGRHICVVLHPGWVQTDMGGPGAMMTPEASVTAMRRVIAGLKSGDSGHFLRYDGRELPW